MTELDEIRKQAYIAALIDSEGYIGIIVEKKPSSVYYRPVISIDMTDRRPLDLLVGVVGYSKDKIHLYLRKEQNRKPVYKILIRAKELLLKLLDYILPFLIVKKEQAKLLKEMLLDVSSTSIRQPYHQKMSVLNS